MQTKKDYTRSLLEKTAQEAFRRKGFSAVSMCEISRLSGVGLSNIYNYYSCKEDLLEVVLRPLLRVMNDMLDNHNCDKNLSLKIFTSEEYHRQSMHEIMNIITRYRKELKLLFLDTQDTQFKDYWERWIEKSTTIGMEYLAQMKKLYPNLHTNISPFFMHFTCSWWINMMREVVLHEELSKEETECFISEYVLFITGGWEKLMDVEDEREKEIVGGNATSYSCEIKKIIYMSVTNIINNEELTLIQGVGGLFLCEESWITQHRRSNHRKNISDKEEIIMKNANINTEHAQTELSDLP